MRNSAIPIKKTYVGVSDTTIYIDVGIEVPDRDTGQSRTLYHSRRLARRYTTGVDLAREMEGLLRGIFIHEFCEAFHVDGVRTLDPHEFDRDAHEAADDAIKDARRRGLLP